MMVQDLAGTAHRILLLRGISGRCMLTWVNARQAAPRISIIPQG